MEIAVAPAWIRSFRILTFTITAIMAILMGSRIKFSFVLTINNIHISATIQMNVTIRNIRSRKLTL